MNMYEREQKRKAWLASLKVGDTVCYSERWHGYVMMTIEKITPTGQIKTNKGITFRDGYCRGSSTWDSGMRLEPFTQKVSDYIHKKSLLHHCKELKLDQLDIKQIETILKTAGIEFPKRVIVEDQNQAKLEL